MSQLLDLLVQYLVLNQKLIAIFDNFLVLVVILFHLSASLFIIIQFFFFRCVGSCDLFLECISSCEKNRLQRLSDEVQILLNTVLIFVEHFNLLAYKINHRLYRRLKLRMLLADSLRYTEARWSFIFIFKFIFEASNQRFLKVLRQFRLLQRCLLITCLEIERCITFNRGKLIYWRSNALQCMMRVHMRVFLRLILVDIIFIDFKVSRPCRLIMCLCHG